MKKYNKILEAINKGVQLALDDYEDDSELSSKSNIIKNDAELIKDKLAFEKAKKRLYSAEFTKDDIDVLAELSNKRGWKIQFTNDLHLIKSIIRGIINGAGNDVDLNWIDVSNITNMNYLFAGIPVFNCDISKWDVSNVENMAYMFHGCNEFNGDISKWDVSNVKNMKFMFSCAKSFNGDISNWDVSNVIDMSYMFCSATKFNQDLSNWDVHNVYNMYSMFYDSGMNYYEVKSDLSNWDVQNVVNSNDFVKETNHGKFDKKYRPKFIKVY